MQQNSVERFPNRTHASNRIFQRLCKRLRNIGSLATRKTDQRGNSGKEMEIGCSRMLAVEATVLSLVRARS